MFSRHQEKVTKVKKENSNFKSQIMKAETLNDLNIIQHFKDKESFAKKDWWLDAFYFNQFFVLHFCW